MRMALQEGYNGKILAWRMRLLTTDMHLLTHEWSDDDTLIHDHEMHARIYACWYLCAAPCCAAGQHCCTQRCCSSSSEPCEN